MLGVAGVWLVVQERVGGGSATLVAWVAIFIALIGITVGTLYQKRFCANMPLRSGAAIQFTTAAVAMLPLAAIFEGLAADWTAEESDMKPARSSGRGTLVRMVEPAIIRAALKIMKIGISRSIGSTGATMT